MFKKFENPCESRYYCICSIYDIVCIYECRAPEFLALGLNEELIPRRPIKIGIWVCGESEICLSPRSLKYFLRETKDYFLFVLWGEATLSSALVLLLALRSYS